MKLDNKGWGLQELLVGIGVLLFCLLLIVSLINRNFRRLSESMGNNSTNNSTEQKRPIQNEEKEYTSYRDIETAMKKAAREYNEAIYGDELQEDDNITVTVKSLIRDKYIEPIHDIKDSKVTCSGYVTFIKEKNKVTYSPYLKCGSRYTTKGYLERLDAEIE